jgi:D-xylose 1-dehydrogenase (NADP+, D-xylono-1,5-lactone-forming)
VSERPLRWAVIGTANIAAKAFLPAMRAAGDVAAVVGSRDPRAAGQWAADNLVERTASYAEAIAADDVDAIYIAVPNDAHVQWAADAAATGRPVLCEKPLGMDAGEVDALLAKTGNALLWEAFVFPFHPQSDLLMELCAPDGPIGGVREIISEFHFRVGSAANIRWRPEHGGGALMDVGCYPIRLARLLFGAEPTAAVATVVPADSGVDAEIAAVLDFPDARRLILSAGLDRAPSTFTRVIGADGEVRLTNPFHPGQTDTTELWQDGRRLQSWPAGPVRAFQHAVEHVAAVVRGETTPRYLAADDALANAQARDLVLRAAGR